MRERERRKGEREKDVCVEREKERLTPHFRLFVFSPSAPPPPNYDDYYEDDFHAEPAVVNVEEQVVGGS